MRNGKTWNTYPWWLLLVGFAFGVLVTLWATQGRVQTVTVYREAGAPDQIWLQATDMIQQATQMAAEMQQSALSNHATANAFGAFDPMLMTVTAIVQQATQQVGQPGALDPIMMTATAIVAQATQQAPR